MRDGLPKREVRHLLKLGSVTLWRLPRVGTVFTAANPDIEGRKYMAGSLRLMAENVSLSNMSLPSCVVCCNSSKDSNLCDRRYESLGAMHAVHRTKPCSRRCGRGLPTNRVEMQPPSVDGHMPHMYRRHRFYVKEIPDSKEEHVRRTEASEQGWIG